MQDLLERLPCVPASVVLARSEHTGSLAAPVLQTSAHARLPHICATAKTFLLVWRAHLGLPTRYVEAGGVEALLDDRLQVCQDVSPPLLCKCMEVPWHVADALLLWDLDAIHRCWGVSWASMNSLIDQMCPFSGI